MMQAIRGVCPLPPAGRRDIPVLNLKPKQIAGLLDRLETFWQRFTSQSVGNQDVLNVLIGGATRSSPKRSRLTSRGYAADRPVR